MQFAVKLILKAFSLSVSQKSKKSIRLLLWVITGEVIFDIKGTHFLINYNQNSLRLWALLMPIVLLWLLIANTIVFSFHKHNDSQYCVWELRFRMNNAFILRVCVKNMFDLRSYNKLSILIIVISISRRRVLSLNYIPHWWHWFWLLVDLGKPAGERVCPILSLSKSLKIPKLTNGWVSLSKIHCSI